MPAPWLSMFEYGETGSETQWEVTIPVRPWSYRSPSVGGSRISATGVPAGYVVRRDHILVVTVRIYETEWPSLFDMIDWANEGAEQVTFYPDPGRFPSTSYACWLDSPNAGEDVAPIREGGFPMAMEIQLTLRKVDGTEWNLEYFADE